MPIPVDGRGSREPIFACHGQRGADEIACLAPDRRVEILLRQRRPTAAIPSAATSWLAVRGYDGDNAAWMPVFLC